MSIFECIERDDIQATRRWLEQNPEAVDQKKEYVGVPVHVARSAEMVQLLLRYGADVNARGWMDATPLGRAAERGDLGVVEALLSAGADANLRRAGGGTPLHPASTSAIIDLLLTETDLKVTDRDAIGRTPLHWAAQFGQTESVRALIHHGADIAAQSAGDETPMHWAAKGGHLQVVKALIEAAAPIDSVARPIERTPLHWAAFRGHQPVIVALLNAGANPNLRDRYGETAYHCAANNNWPKVAELLLAHSSQEDLGTAARVQTGAPKSPVLQSVRSHPAKREAVGALRDGSLAHWELGESPHITRWIQTPHSQIRDIALAPGKNIVAVAARGKDLEVRRLSDFAVERLIPVGDEDGTSALDYSPDGRWLAVADLCLQIHLVDNATGKLMSSVEGGEWTSCVRFSHDGSLLASARCYQGGGNLRIDRVTPDARLDALCKFTRCNINTPGSELVDTLNHIEFAPDCSTLALFETSAIGRELKPTGWIGNIVLFDIDQQIPRWITAITGQTTGDNRSLEDSGHEMGYATQVAFMDDQLFCGARGGKVMVLDLSTGQVVRRHDLDIADDVSGLIVDHAVGQLWAVTSAGLTAIRPLD